MKKEETDIFMAHELTVPELTFRGILLGAILTVIFTASNVYLGLKVGLTFSSAIPAAVISMAVLKMFKDANILENNMVQTQASAAGTLSAVIFIIPGLLMLGYWQGFEFWQTLLVSGCGGCLGVLFTIPLRRAMVVHTDLPYPEGVAAAEILKVGCQKAEKGTSSGIKEIVAGSFLGGIIAFLTNGLQVLAGGMSFWLTAGKSIFQIPLGFSTALVGAGYLVGIIGGLAMLTGIIIAWGICVPYFTSQGLPADGQSLAAYAQGIWSEKVRLIGAGAMGVAAVWTLIMLAKPVLSGLNESIKAMKSPQEVKDLHRMDTDMSIMSILAVFVVMVVALLGTFYSFVAPANLPLDQTLVFVVVGVLTAILMGFFVAAACAYMAGLIGTSSSPISGIGILGIIVSSLVVMALATHYDLFSMPGGNQFATAIAIFTTSIILSIACISNDNMQDLKTGWLVGATPWRQQVALLIGCIVGALVIAPVLNLLYEAYGFTGAMPRSGMDESAALAAPQAGLMTTIAKGIFTSQLAWEYIYVGVALGVVLVIIDKVIIQSSNARMALPPLAVGMGIYLPPTVQMPLVVGAVMGYFVDKHLKKRALLRSPENVEADVEAGRRNGTLFASGLIVGESIIGVIMAGVIVFSVTNGGSEAPLALNLGDSFKAMTDVFGLFAFIIALVLFVRYVLSAKKPI